jgi:hypothetical protein
MLLAGGIMQHGFQCGQVWGAGLASGARAYQLFGPGPEGETAAVVAAQRTTNAFKSRYNTINCIDITDMDKSSSNLKMIKFFLLKGGVIRCFNMAGKYANVALEEIDAAFSENDIQVPEPPISCTALLAQKLGLSEKQQTMLAGLAGGIGLSGGACGALGTAIWNITMRKSERESGKTNKPDLADPDAAEAITGLLKVTDFEFECSKIAGRQFESVEDHAAYLREGGCAEVIEALAEQT